MLRSLVMRRRPILARTALVTGVLAMLAGCTFLIDFEEVPRAADADGSDGSPPLGPPDVSVDVVAPDSGDAAVDGRDALANPDACHTALDGKYCGNDQIVWPAERKDDLITCKGKVIASVRLCATGQGCFGMLDGYPDECDECVQKADGTYCGRDLPGWDAKNAQQRIRCQGGRIVGSLLCGVCKSNGGTSACQ